MVYSVASEERRGVAAELSMATNSERPAKLLHNFNLPFDLRWGNQRHLRCMKVDSDGEDDDAAFDRRSSGARVRRGESESSGGVGGSAAQFDRRSIRQPRRPRIGGEEVEEGIEAVREKLMFEFKTAADKMKDAILRGGEEMEVEEEQHEEVPSNTDVAAEIEGDVDAEAVGGSSSPTAASASAVAAALAARPWNLRTRRAACKAPLIGGGKGIRIEEKKANYSPLRSDVGGHHHHHHHNDNNNGGGGKSPRPVRGASGSGSGSGSDSGPRPKFSLTLTKKEIEEDFIQMLGHRPPRRPKKRPRAVQRQLDALFPGTWLTEVTPDSYKVPEFAENVKR